MNGYTRHREIEEVLGALERLGGPGQVLRGVALRAADTYRSLDVGGQAHNADRLATAMVDVLRQWTISMGGGIKTPKPPGGAGSL